MGRDKAFLPIDGEPLAVRTARILEEAGCHPVTLVGRQSGLRALGWSVLTEPDGTHHPLRGVAAALAISSGPLVLFAPCDLPCLTPTAVRLLLEAGQPCIAADQPLLCVLSPEAASHAAHHASAGGSVYAFMAGLPQIALPPQVLLNANTPEELARFR